jgi:hypothetical protein
MNNKFEREGCNYGTIEVLSGIWMKKLRKTTKSLSQERMRFKSSNF